MKNVIITGGSTGIGYGMAKHFLIKGCKVTICGRNEHTLLTAVERLKNETKNYNIKGIRSDVTQYEEVQNLWIKANETFGNVDIWINNAGVDQKRKSSWEMTLEEIDTVIDINIKGMMYGCMVAVKKMQEQGYGFIYNMEGFGSDGAVRESLTLYGMTKKALRYYSRGLAKELKGSGVKVGRLSPGMVLTDFLKKGLPEDPEEAKKVERIYAILADEVDVVTEYLVNQILKNTKNDKLIAWLTKTKVMKRFITARSRIKKYNGQEQ